MGLKIKKHTSSKKRKIKRQEMPSSRRDESDEKYVIEGPREGRIV
jgi:hypothetical protein